MIDINLLLSNNNLFETIDQYNIEQITKDIKPHLNSTISFLSNKVANNTSLNNNSKLAKESFEYSVDLFLNKTIETYIRRKRWREKTPFNLYLNKALISYANNIIKDYNIPDNGHATKLICPACNYYKINTIINGVSGNVTCDYCSAFLNSNSTNKDETSFRKVFSIYSIKGFACNHCNNYIPFSYVSDGFTTCVYPNCKKELNIGNLKFKNHPVKVFSRIDLLLNNKKIVDDENSTSFIDSIISDKNENALSLLQQEELDNHLLLNVYTLMETQKKANTTESKKIPTKICMYNAFIETLKEYPVEMVNYLTVGGQGSSGDISIQSIIYQNYAKLVLEKLPLLFYNKGNEIKITDPTDDRLYLFNGVKQFYGFINHNLIIRKKIQDIVLPNGDICKDNEESFIGLILKIQDDNGNDLSEYVEHNSFSFIKFKSTKEIKQGMEVFVKYYSVIPNYTVGSMIQLQRIKKKLSQSLNKNIQKNKER